ncbi:MAG TPA: nickel pincer cofactor biosynthesis protein LarC [Pyrinomonadaceae bacterium]|nr:nickel pincer cofactor biosynthesis protein LarC [Pyrinomonadaceae bacterium]
MKTLYFDCFAGASGNMTLAALVSLGVDKTALIEQLRRLNISDFNIEFSTVDRSGISAVYADVKVPHERVHRHLSDIKKIINESTLSEAVKERAVAIFTRLAEAEAKIHGIEVEKVHFHEVGAMDAIVDVVGACIGFEMLGIERFTCSKVHVGSGFAQMAHGRFPIPPPAVAELLTRAPIYSTDIEGELITPTGAAIISTVCESYGAIPELKVERTGYGAGTREYKDFPNALRIILGETDRNAISDHRPLTTDHLVLLETNIDDLSPQILGYVMDKAFLLGALDCWFTPIQMKKNRPATMVSVLCDLSKKDDITALLYSETSTLGVRLTYVDRECLPREVVKVRTEHGEVAVKIARFNDKIVNAKPEYDQVREIAERIHKPLKEVEQEVLDKLNNNKSLNAA